MILPKNGRIAIIDDDRDQAFPLISALSKNNFATTFFDAKKESLPEKKLNDIRVLFLDINLNGGQQPNWATEKAMLISNVSAILEPRIPYILFVWSVNEKEHIEDLKTLFEEELKEYKPLTFLEMNKSDIFKQNPEDDNVGWSLNYTASETISLITQKINEGITTIDSFEALLKWENAVAMSTTETTNEIISLATGKENLNQDLKKIYYKLAEAMWGRQLTPDPNEITNKAVSVFTDLLHDRLAFNIVNNLTFDIITNIEEPKTFEDGDKAIFNSKLLLNFHKRGGAFPGNVYEYKGEAIEQPPFNGLIADSLFIPLVSHEFFKTKNGKEPETSEAIRECKNQNKKEYGAYEKSIRDKIKANSRFVCLEISPICDFAQKKWKMNRICVGMLWPFDLVQYIGKSDNLYVSPLLIIDGKLCNIVLDLRYFSSEPFTFLKDLNPIFTLKHTFLTDIQSQLSRHINRPGITSLN